MAKSSEKRARRTRVRRGIRKTIHGTSARPRLSVYRSNKHIYAQLINDLDGHTLASASSRNINAEGEAPMDVSHEVGKQLADRAEEAGIQSAVFDRSGYRYHGRVQALAEGAREGGLNF